MRYVPYDNGSREHRLIHGITFGGNNEQMSPDARQEYLRQQGYQEDIRRYSRPQEVSNGMNLRMNTTSERLGKSRDEYMEDLRKYHNYLSALLREMRKHGARTAREQRYNARGQMAISPRYGGPTGPMAMERNAERMAAQDRFGNQFSTIAQIEQEIDRVQFEMAKIYAERKAGIPDSYQPSSPEAQSGQLVGGISVLTTGQGQQTESQFARFQESAPREAVDAVSSLPEQLQEIGARLWFSLPKGPEQESMIKLCNKLREADAETLQKFFALYFKDGKPLDPKTVTIDEKDPIALKAAALAASLTPDEFAVAGKFIEQGIRMQEGAVNFNELSPETQARIQKYVRRFNKAESDSGEKLIAEGMLYLDGVDVEASMKGKEIDKDNIAMLEKEARFMGFISGWIKVILGWKKLLGGMSKGKDEVSKRKEPSEMTLEERNAEIAANTKEMDEIKGRVKVLPEEIKTLEGKIRDLPSDTNPDEKKRMTDALAAKKKELEDAPGRIKELEDRNAALAAAVEKKKSVIPESSRVAYEKAGVKATDISTKYRIKLDIAEDGAQNYERSLIVLERLETLLKALTPDELKLLQDATVEAGGKPSFTTDAVSLSLKDGAGDTATTLATSLKDKLDAGTIDADPRVRFVAEKVKFSEMMRAEFNRYFDELTTNPIIRAIAERSGLKMDDPRFKEFVAKQKENMAKMAESFVNASSIEKNDAGLFRAVIDLPTFRKGIEAIMPKEKVEGTITAFMEGAHKAFPMTKEGNTMVSGYMSLDALLGSDFVKALVDPARKEVLPDFTAPIA